MRQYLIILVLSFNLSASSVTINEIYSQSTIISQEIHSLLRGYGLSENYNKSFIYSDRKTQLKARNIWQKTYEIMIKINMLRVSYGLPIVEPVNLAPILNLDYFLVYEQTQRILTEIKIFKHRVGIEDTKFKIKNYSNKTSIDIFNVLNDISVSLDKLNKTEFTPSYVFGESMRVYDDLSVILQYLNIKDNTIPSIRNNKANPSDTFEVAVKILDKIAIIQASVGIQSVDFSFLKNSNPNPSDVFTMVQMIISELQTIKAFIGLDTKITPAATQYSDKTPADVDQLINWSLRKLELIDNLLNVKEGI